jgi:N-acetylmuramoyl-L-alanine amidase
MQIHNIVDALAKHPTKKYTTRPLSQINGIVIHHYAVVATPQAVASYHVNTLGWPGIGYHFAIEPDGKIQQTNKLETISYHVGNPNWRTIGIALNGNFMINPPTQKALDSARWLTNYIRNLPAITIKDQFGHGQFPGGTATACPGATWPQWIDHVFSPLAEGDKKQVGDVVPTVRNATVPAGQNVKILQVTPTHYYVQFEMWFNDHYID